MEILKYFGLGLGFFITAATAVIIVYCSLDVLCETIVCKFDMYIDSANYRTYKDMSESDKVRANYIVIVLDKVLPWTLGAAISVGILIMVGSVISDLFGV